MGHGPPQADNEFLKQVTACQSKVYAFALSLLGDPDAAADVQQETNVVIWEKASEARDVRNFTSWVMQIAYFQVQNHRRSRRREKMLFDNDVLEMMAEESANMTSEFDDRLRALHGCLEKLPDRQRELLNERYRHGVSVKSIAERLSRPANQVGVVLFRIRAALFECITRSIKEGER